MARTKVHPLTEVTNDPYITLPLTKAQYDALERALRASHRFRKMEMTLGVTDLEGEQLDSTEQEAMEWWLRNAFRDGVLTRLEREDKDRHLISPA